MQPTKSTTELTKNPASVPWVIWPCPTPVLFGVHRALLSHILPECQRHTHMCAGCLTWSNLLGASPYPSNVLVHMPADVTASGKKPTTSLQRCLLPLLGLAPNLLLLTLLQYEVPPTQQ